MMKLYHKQLDGVKDLQREKKSLEKKARDMEKTGVASISSLKGFAEGAGGGLGIGSLLKMASGQSALLKPVIRFVQQKLSQRKADEYSAGYNSKHKKRKNILKEAAVEVIGGYLKWKAIELSLKSIRNYIKNRKEQKE